ncbi:diguanylate cyclase [Aphanothece hegewaldii CCALA 016]|uniref:Diguanylate cyclase n=1 Tax=Aphanothece hegewaldii CCALA 016 TaxID=2107694 RepID=A0A2T1LUL4_9CHRO|nr:AAA-like domain-containing protein [Aphanothece hegewaldii]PSF35252.1 diguanylate cyclase [Aphanothece hegewaldii CCALA 016]
MISSEPLATPYCMTIDEVIRLLDNSQLRNITPLQDKVLRLAWEGRTYAEMASALHYQDAYLKNIASGLWQELSLLFGEPITKTNFSYKLKNRSLTEEQQQYLDTPNNISSRQQKNTPESPYGPVPLNSDFYVERPPVEELAFMEVHKPGGVIRLKAPAKMGKSSLLLRIIAQAKIVNYHTIQIDFREIDQTRFENLDKLLRWFCTVISRQLNLKPKLNEYWDDDIGSKVNCSYYLQHYILSNLENPLVISFNDIHHILAYSELAANFLSLLRYWYEQSRQSEIWQKLRMILVHSTEIYVPLRFHESPFNVGLPITIPEFTLPQIQELAKRHGLDWNNATGTKYSQILMTLIGGHPYLVRLALYYICWRGMSLETLITEASTSKGIYREHLQNYLVILQSHPELLNCWLLIVTSTEPVQLETVTVYCLESLGLIKIVEGGVVPRCELYRQYFHRQLLLVNLMDNQLKRLEEDNQRLQENCYIDQYTQTGNRRGFNQTLEIEWRRMTRNKLPIALILCHVAFFKTYENSLDEFARNDYLKQVAPIIKNCVQRASDYVARYDDNVFGIILPETSLPGATKVAERIRQNIELIVNEEILGSITVNVGVACIIPEIEINSSFLEHEAQKALYRSRRMGPNTIIVSSLLDE